MLPETVTVAQLIEQLINPLLNLLAAFLRPLGLLAAGVAAGSVLRHAVLNAIRGHFSMPLVFLGIAVLFWATADGRWSSPAALAGLGFGVLIGYMGRRPRSAPDRAPGAAAVEAATEASFEEAES